MNDWWYTIDTGTGAERVTNQILLARCYTGFARSADGRDCWFYRGYHYAQPGYGVIGGPIDDGTFRSAAEALRRAGQRIAIEMEPALARAAAAIKESAIRTIQTTPSNPYTEFDHVYRRDSARTSRRVRRVACTALLGGLALTIWSVLRGA